MYKISVITISYNCVHEIEKTILSVIEQTYPNIEYLIIDGNSSDGTVSIINKYDKYISKWISEPDTGIYHAMNKGIELASGDYINFMNAGDTFSSKDSISQMFVEECHSDILYGNVNICTSLGTHLWIPEPLFHIKKRMIMGHLSIFAKSEVLKLLKFDMSYRSSGDYDFLYRCYKLGYSFEYRNVLIGNFEGDNGFSNNNYKLVAYENARIQGVINLKKWKVLFCLKYFWHNIKQSLKKLLPYKLVAKIKYINYKRICK